MEYLDIYGSRSFNLPECIYGNYGPPAVTSKDCLATYIWSPNFVEIRFDVAKLQRF